MPIKEPDTYAVIWQWLQTQLGQHSIFSFGLTFFIAVVRICYVGKTRSKLRVLLEATLCGLIAVASESVFEYLAFPPKLAVALGAIIALFGIDEIRALAKRYVSTKMQGGRNE